MEGKHTRFMQQIKGKQARRRMDRKWVTPVAKKVWEATGTQLAATYIGLMQGAVAQLVALGPIFEV